MRLPYELKSLIEFYSWSSYKIKNNKFIFTNISTTLKNVTFITVFLIFYYENNWQPKFLSLIKIVVNLFLYLKIFNCLPNKDKNRVKYNLLNL